MPDPETIPDAIEEAALGNIRRVTTGNVSIESHSIKDLIEADKYANQVDETAAELPTFGLRRRRQIPGGCG